MLIPDSETRRQLVRERQAELRQEMLVANPLRHLSEPDSRRPRRRLELRSLQFHLRSGGRSALTLTKAAATRALATRQG
jgi:hypothetical protein